MCEAKSSTHSHVVVGSAPREKGALWLPGKPAEGQAPPCPLTSTVWSWPGPGWLCRKVSPAPGTQVKQALVGQGMDREQEDSHLEWPDHTDRSSQPFNLICFSKCKLV